MRIRTVSLCSLALLLVGLAAGHTAVQGTRPTATVTVQAVGEAAIQGGDVEAAKKAALAAAGASAVEQAVLARLDEETRGRNGERIRALLREKGADLAAATVLKVDGAAGNTYRVEGQFQVMLVPALKLLREGGILPVVRALVTIPEVYLIRPAAQPAGEAEIVRQLIAAGVTVVTPPKGTQLGFGTSTQAALDAARAAGADVLLLGVASTDGATTPIMGMQASHARVDVQAILVATGEVMAREAGEGAGAQTTSVAACQTAVQRAATGVGAKLVESVLLAPVSGRAVALDAGPFAALGAAADFERALAAFPGIRKAERRSYAEGTLTLDLQVARDAADGLAEALEKAETLRPFGVSVASAERDRIHLHVAPRPPE